MPKQRSHDGREIDHAARRGGDQGGRRQRAVRRIRDDAKSCERDTMCGRYAGRHMGFHVHHGRRCRPVKPLLGARIGERDVGSGDIRKADVAPLPDVAQSPCADASSAMSISERDQPISQV